MILKSKHYLHHHFISAINLILLITSIAFCSLNYEQMNVCKYNYTAVVLITYFALAVILTAF
jgi:hypothetical protein